MPIDAVLYDGTTANRQEVQIEAVAGGLRLTHDDGSEETLAAGIVKRLGRDQDRLRLGRSDLDGWRLLLPISAEGAIEPVIGKEERYGRWIDRVGLLPALAGFGVLAAAVLVIGYVSPQLIAPHVPTSWERNVGDAIVGDFGENRCRGKEGQRVLDALVERLLKSVSVEENK